MKQSIAWCSAVLLLLTVLFVGFRLTRPTVPPQHVMTGAELEEKYRKEFASPEFEERFRSASARAIPHVTSTEDGGWEVVQGFLLMLILMVVYFVPAYVGRKKRNAAAILALNLLLGWTLIGWVVALVWALTVEELKVAKQ
jgi:hypothetical protein